MHQTLGNNFGINSYQPKLTVIEQKDPQDKEPNMQIQSLCPSDWSNYLHVEDDIDNENTDKTEPPTDQLTMSQDTCTDAKTVVRLPQALVIQKQGTSKNNTTEPMTIVVVGNTNQIWDQKTFPLQRQDHQT